MKEGFRKSDFLDDPLKEASLPQSNSYKVILSWGSNWAAISEYPRNLLKVKFFVPMWFG